MAIRRILRILLLGPPCHPLSWVRAEPEAAVKDTPRISGCLVPRTTTVKFFRQVSVPCATRSKLRRGCRWRVPNHVGTTTAIKFGI